MPNEIVQSFSPSNTWH